MSTFFFIITKCPGHLAGNSTNYGALKLTTGQTSMGPKVWNVVSNLGKPGSSSAVQIFDELELGPSSFQNLTNKPKHSKVQVDLASLQP